MSARVVALLRAMKRERKNASAAVAALEFGHSAETLAVWRGLVERALTAEATPFYLFSCAPVAEAIGELDRGLGASRVPVRHWLSCKTQPVRPMLRWWLEQGRPIEVVSDFELRAALAEGFAAERKIGRAHV